MAQGQTKLRTLDFPPSLKEMAYQSIKEAILSKRFKPGEIYNEVGLGKELGISKTPVREALLDLASKGFVKFIPRKGIQINTLSVEEIRDLYLFRAMIEKGIIPIIIEILTTEDIQKIEAINDNERKAIEKNSLVVRRLNREFHMSLAELTGSKKIVSSLEDIYDLMDWIRSDAILGRDCMTEYHKQHKKIIDMLKKRNLRGAEAMVEEHIRITEGYVCEGINS